MPTTEQLLALGLIIVYVFDATHFLRIGEAVVETRGRALKRVSFGWPFELAGRQPFLPNLLTPFQPAFRIEWDLAGGSVTDVESASQEMRAVLAALRPIGWTSGACGLLIVLAAPVCLILADQVWFLGAVAASVLIALVGCIIVIVRRKVLRLDAKQVISICFVALICVPCSANLARAVAGNRRWILAAADLPRLGFEPADATATCRLTVTALSNAKRYVAQESREFRVIDEQVRLLGDCNS
ncbi:MAG TPA: hypothetical protein VGM84_09850 [Steroidobacteraceae bacterium]|jgi:hypothetical protein